MHDKMFKFYQVFEDHFIYLCFLLQVFRFEDGHNLYTLYGHKGGVTSLHLDPCEPAGAVSGGEEGSVRIWNLDTGVCLHILHGHTAPVTSVTATRAHVVSSGLDDRLCIWLRERGTMMHWLQLGSGLCSSVSMLNNSLMLSSAQV